MKQAVQDVPRRSSDDYWWELLSDGLQPLLKFTGSKIPLGLVKIDHKGTSPQCRYGEHSLELFSRHGDMLNWIDSAIEFSDGTIVLCAHISSWNGTFVEDTNHTKYYGLTPKAGHDSTPQTSDEA